MARSKKSSYDAATQKIVEQLRSMKMPENFKPEFDAIETAITFRRAFTTPPIRKLLLNPAQENARIASANFSAGFCGIASYAWNQMFRMPDGGEVWQLYQTVKPISHVWLKNKFTNEILDLTFDQFSEPYPYESGQYVPSDFYFARAVKFGEHIGIDIENLMFINTLKSLGGRK